MGWRRSELSCAQSLVKRIWISGWPARITRRLNPSPRWHRKLRKSMRNSSPSSPVKRWAWSLVFIWTFYRLQTSNFKSSNWELKKLSINAILCYLAAWLEIFLKCSALCHETKTFVRATEDMMSCLTNGLPVGRATHTHIWQFECVFSFSKLGRQFGNSKWDEQQELAELSSGENQAKLCVDSHCQIFDFQHEVQYSFQLILERLEESVSLKC